MLRIKQQPSPSTLLKELVPLKQIHIDAHIHSFAADVTITQIFENDESVPIEAVYCFPVEENAAIYSFVARVDDDREIVAELKEKRAAQQDYTQALAQGHGAYLFEQDAASNDIFTVSVGALKPGSKCCITISYVSELDLLHGSEKPTIRFVVPTTVAPRYSPAHNGISSPGGTQVPYADSVSYTIKFDCRVDRLDQDVAGVSSSSHPIKVDLSNEEIFLVNFGQEEVQLDRDIIVDIELSQVTANTIAAIDNGAMMVSFMPTEEDCRRGSNNKLDELLFVIDCSGSMAGESNIGLAKKAMLLFVKSLPVGCRFNIIRFGSTFTSLFSSEVTREYNEENMCSAEALIKSMQADLGGTELLKPLGWLQKHKPAAGCVRQVFLLTDGEVSNVDEVTKLCSEMAEYTRIFSFGLGYSPSRALVKGFARATNGRFTFIAPNTNVNIHVAEQLARALQPSITDVNINWKTSQPILGTVPKQALPVFAGDRMLFYALLDDSSPFDHNITAEITSKKYEQPACVVRVDRIPSVLTTPTVTRLAAKALLRELQDASDSTPKERLVDLSIKYGILCPHTAFIGVEKRLAANASSNADMELREVPIMLGPISANRSQRLQCDIYAAQASTQQNLVMMLEREEKIEALVCRSEGLSTGSASFYYRSAKRKPKWNLSFGSVLQPIAGYFSSLFAVKNDTVPAADVVATDPEPKQYLALAWPTTEQQLVEKFVERQQYDGLWTLTDDDVQQLTGKPVTHFASSVLDAIDTSNRQVAMTTALVIVILETRCVASRTLWQIISNKARQRLTQLCQGDHTRVQQLVEDIHDQLV